MTFDKEWADAKATTSGTAHDLVVTQDDLGAVGHEAYVLHGELRKRIDLAGAGATSRAATECSGRDLGMGAELLTTLSTWEAQVKTVLQMCAHISNHLDYSKKSHAADDERIAADLRRRDGSAMPVSEIARYVK
ncbi:hypothetical protein [Streptomyces sp. NBC_01294]|uniref:hypothetical protein n=1 Tax=Streptomyces sp. NBC_01294 TaxID=2903815 RepID=UPI002DD819E3|nr:hypothetical protein [Streptomyces sp. NBC_01294]WRZ59600.1 hypothetical protein OG534_25820 [Streptomyces sp. NBC_01294]